MRRVGSHAFTLGAAPVQRRTHRRETVVSVNTVPVGAWSGTAFEVVRYLCKVGTVHSTALPTPCTMCRTLTSGDVEELLLVIPWPVRCLLLLAVMRKPAST